MTNRADIVDGQFTFGKKYGLVYTKRCGWIDLGHANPDGAMGLWKNILHEIDSGNSKNGYFRIAYKQIMGNKHAKVGVLRKYDVKKNLSLSLKQSIALSIFLDVSHSFESMQASLPYSLITNSGYSAEDLISNLVGFYRAINPNYSYVQSFQPVSKDTALQIWDKFGPVGKNKNYSLSPYLYPIPPNEGGPISGVLPFELKMIKPVKPGDLYVKVG